MPYLNDVLSTKKVTIPNCPFNVSWANGGFRYFPESNRLAMTQPKEISIEFKNLGVMGRNSLKFIRYSLEAFKKNVYL